MKTHWEHDSENTLRTEHLEAVVATVGDKQAWLRACHQKKMEWRGFLTARQAQAPLQDPVWGKPVLTQPAAIKEVCDFAKAVDGIKFFDAGDVQANGFQTVEDEHVGDTFTDTGASYMGFATSAVTAAGLADSPRYAIALVGDGSFMMNPQALISAVEHRAHALIVIFDNRRMAAITGLQQIIVIQWIQRSLPVGRVHGCPVVNGSVAAPVRVARSAHSSFFSANCFKASASCSAHLRSISFWSAFNWAIREAA